MKLQKRFKRFLRFAALWPLLALLEVLPRPMARETGAIYGRLAYALLPRLRRTCREQRTLIGQWPSRDLGGASTTADLPEVPLAEAGHFDRAVFEWIGRTAVDFLRLGRDREPFENPRISGLEHLVAAESSGRPVLVATAHFGSWELLGSWLARRSRGVAVLYHPFSEGRLDRRVSTIRRRAGIGLIPVGRSALPIRRALEAGTLVGVLLDRVPRGVGVESSFFGRPCRTDPGTARLALLTEALVLVAAMWEDRPGEYRIRFWPAIESQNYRGDAEAVPKLVELLDRCVEEMIVEAPTQWPWFYPRWKIRGTAYQPKG